MIDGRVSIITTTFNSESYITGAIESVLAQTYSDWEMVITDDCSTDSSREIVRKYAEQDSRIKLLVLETNSGPGVARNNSILNASGRYIAFLDSDDTWMPDKLEKQLALMRKTGCGMTYSSYYVVDEDGNNSGMVICKSKVRYWRIVCDNAIGFLTLMYDRAITGDELMPSIRKRQDWGLNIKLLKKCRVAYGIKEPLASYRIRKGSVSNEKLPLIKFNVAIYRQVLGYSKVGAICMFSFIFMPFYLGKKFLNIFKALFWKRCTT